MGFDIFQYPEVDRDILYALEYYAQFSMSAVSHFERELSNAYDALERNPFFQVRYKNVRALPFKSLPYMVLFLVNEEKKTVEVLSIFNTYQDTKKISEIEKSVFLKFLKLKENVNIRNESSVSRRINYRSGNCNLACKRWRLRRKRSSNC